MQLSTNNKVSCSESEKKGRIKTLADCKFLFNGKREDISN